MSIFEEILNLLGDGAWRVEFETRKFGAIGAFSPQVFITRASGRDQALKFARDDAELDGMEIRLPLKAQFLGKWRDYLEGRV